MSASSILRRLTRLVRSQVPARPPLEPTSADPSAHPTSTPRPPRGRDDTSEPPAAGPYPGDFQGRVDPVYAPDLDGAPDPGEIVWTWVPYEEDHTRGKDRPVLVVGHDGPWLLGLMLSSRDHDAAPGRPGEDWLDLGSGDWDPRGRQSEVRVDRVIRLDPTAVRREGAVLDRPRFDRVADRLR